LPHAGRERPFCLAYQHGPFDTCSRYRWSFAYATGAPAPTTACAAVTTFALRPNALSAVEFPNW